MLRTRLTFDQSIRDERKSFHDLHIFARVSDRAEKLDAVPSVASNIHDVRTCTKDAVRACRKNNCPYLWILLPLESVLDGELHLAMRVDDAQGVKVG